jgi:hypothetical protein
LATIKDWDARAGSICGPAIPSTLTAAMLFDHFSNGSSASDRHALMSSVQTTAHRSPGEPSTTGGTDTDWADWKHSTLCLEYLTQSITPPETVEKILALRREKGWCPILIEGYLRRVESIQIGHTAIHRLLKQAGLNNHPRNPDNEEATDAGNVGIRTASGNATSRS